MSQRGVVTGESFFNSERSRVVLSRLLPAAAPAYNADAQGRGKSMPESEESPRNPWLVAGWPGIGGVSIAAVAYLVDTLDMELAHEIPAREFFDTRHIEVTSGIARTPRLPRSRIFRWKNPQPDGRDLFVFAGEAQPQSRGDELCNRIIDFAKANAVKRVVTFAALASQSEPTIDPQVHAAVTQPAMLSEIRSAGIQTLEEGQVGGLNGVLLAAALAQSIPAMSLLAEMPFFATGVPNLQSSRAVLRAFSTLSGIEPDMDGMDERAHAVVEALHELMEKLQRAHEEDQQAREQEFAESDADHDEPDAPRPDHTPALAESDRRRIEEMFSAAEENRARAADLKDELDRLGVFTEYENRFLDLFKRAE